MLPVIQWKRMGAKTAAAGTAIQYLLDPGSLRGRVIVTRMAILTAATAQTLTVMQVLAKYRVSQVAAAGQAKFMFLDTEVPVATMAANDILAIKMPSGKHEKYIVSAVGAVVSGEYEVTLTANLTAELPKGSAVCFFGVVSDGHEQVAIPASVTTVFSEENGYFGSNEMGEPMILSLNNITNAATIQAINCPVIGV